MTDQETADADLILAGREKDLGELVVRRVLPAVRQRSVGPFLFLDHMGPVDFAPGGGINVRPHPHIGLSTLTYLFEGEIEHRDSLGCFQPIRPLEVNWMVAGRGVSHSERTNPARQAAGGRLHGLQVWLGLPLAAQEVAPSFTHHPAGDIPQLRVGGVQLRVVAGAAFGVQSPVATHSPLFYVDALFETDGELEVPQEYSERAAYVVSGMVYSGANTARLGELFVFHHPGAVTLRAAAGTRVVLLGGEPLDGPRRKLWWNFVYTDEARLEAAKQAWQDRSFPQVSGDEEEFIPLPSV